MLLTIKSRRNKSAPSFSIFYGYTLIELMTTVLIISILSAVAQPSLNQWVESSRAKAVKIKLTGLLSESRSYALVASKVVTICSLGESQCESELSFPLSSFIDPNRNRIKDSGDEVIRVVDADLPEHIRLIWNRTDYLQFWPNGGTGALTGSLSYCSSFDQKNDFRLVISRVGRIRVDYEETRCPL